MSFAEKTISDLKDTIKKIDADRSRLANFKLSKVDLLKELEVKVKKYDLEDRIDTSKLV